MVVRLLSIEENPHRCPPSQIEVIFSDQSQSPPILFHLQSQPRGFFRYPPPYNESASLLKNRCSSPIARTSFFSTRQTKRFTGRAFRQADSQETCQSRRAPPSRGSSPATRSHLKTKSTPPSTCVIGHWTISVG